MYGCLSRSSFAHGISDCPLLDELLYPSESDEPVVFFSRDWSAERPPEPGEVAVLLEKPESESVVERDPAEFWELVTFVALREMLETSLTHTKYFEVGETEVTLLLVGLAEGRLCGIMTMAVRR